MTFCCAWQEPCRPARPRSRCSTLTSTSLAHMVLTSCWTFWEWSLRSKAYSKSWAPVVHHVKSKSDNLNSESILNNKQIQEHLPKCSNMTIKENNRTDKAEKKHRKSKDVLLTAVKNLRFQLLCYTIHLFYAKKKCLQWHTFLSCFLFPAKYSKCLRAHLGNREILTDLETWSLRHSTTSTAGYHILNKRTL